MLFRFLIDGKEYTARMHDMAWFLKLKEAGQAAGIPLPQHEEKRIATNFIR